MCQLGGASLAHKAFPAPCMFTARPGEVMTLVAHTPTTLDRFPGSFTVVHACIVLGILRDERLRVSVMMALDFSPLVGPIGHRGWLAEAAARTL